MDREEAKNLRKEILELWETEKRKDLFFNSLKRFVFKHDGIPAKCRVKYRFKLHINEKMTSIKFNGKEITYSKMLKKFDKWEYSSQFKRFKDKLVESGEITFIENKPFFVRGLKEAIYNIKSFRSLGCEWKD